MDELIIEDKKYVSSKRAALITGYAKDYVGQLAREGYVAARRVGRSWYVLESAIKDHRFGNPSQTNSSELQVDKKEPQSVTSTWEAPRYVSENLYTPSINRLHDDVGPVTTHTEVPEEAVSGEHHPHEDFQDTWQTWFDTFRRPAPVTAEPQEPWVAVGDQHIEEEDAKAEEERLEAPDEPYEAAQVPIHMLPNAPRLSPVAPRTHIPALRLEKPMALKDRHRESPSGGAVTIFIIRVVAMLLALTFVVAGALGTGYFDKKLISSIQARRVAGFSIYNK